MNKPESLHAQNDIGFPTFEPLTSSLTEAMNTAPTSVFAGVGRKFPTWKVGVDLLIISTPHYSAYRKLGLNNYSLWGEWWATDFWGLKTIYSEQSFKLFAAADDAPDAVSKHAGALVQAQHALSSDWRVSAGIGLAKTVLSYDNTNKNGMSLVTEFRTGLELKLDFWLDLGILTIDGASGSNTEDQRLGSTGYYIGLGYGF